MSDSPTPPDLERQAREHVENLKGFYVHAGVFVVINALLFAINLITTPGAFWALWPLLGWGAGLGAHAVSVFGIFGLGGEEWERRKVREFMLRQQSSLSADDVRRLLREEQSAQSDTVPEWAERVNQRLENLETIVTSQDWDKLPQPAIEADHASEPAPEDAEEIARRIARRVR